MAQFPCDMCGARYRGPQQTVYPAIVNGAESERRKMRLCPPEFGMLFTWLEDHFYRPDDPNNAATCSVCGAADPPYACFVTVYATGRDRDDFYGRSCADCRPKVQSALFGPIQARLTT